MQADRIIRAIRLSLRWPGCPNRDDRQNAQSWKAHQNLLRDGASTHRSRQTILIPVNSHFALLFAAREIKMIPAPPACSCGRHVLPIREKHTRGQAVLFDGLVGHQKNSAARREAEKGGMEPMLEDEAKRDHTSNLR
jgi:hypothetical protein